MCEFISVFKQPTSSVVFDPTTKLFADEVDGRTFAEGALSEALTRSKFVPV